MGDDVDVSLADPRDQRAWDQLVCNAPGSEVYHLFGWKDLFEKVFGHQCFYLIARDEDRQVVGVLPLVHIKSRLFGNFIVSVPCFNYCGILALTEPAVDALAGKAKEIAFQAGAAHVELRHTDGVRCALPARHDKVRLRLALPGKDDELWRSFSSKLKSQIRRPDKEGAEYLRGGVEFLEDFYDVFSRNMRDLGTPVYPKSLFREIFARFAEFTTIFVVRLGGQTVASSLTIGFKDTLEVPFASSLRQYNRSAPNMGLYWQMMQHAVNNGFSVFDFGRCTVNSGSYYFKKQWGAEPTPLVWHYILTEPGDLPYLNPDNPKFRMAINLWRRLPVAVANFLGPQVVKYLP